MAFTFNFKELSIDDTPSDLISNIASTTSLVFCVEEIFTTLDEGLVESSLKAREPDFAFSVIGLLSSITLLQDLLFSASLVRGPTLPVAVIFTEFWKLLTAAVVDGP